jgi:Ca2+-binding RTX toxin-like protein
MNINGTDASDNLTGTSDADLIRGMAGNDTLYGTMGNDTLDGGTQVDSMIGGSGDDIYYFDTRFDKAQENLNEGADLIVYTAPDTYIGPANIERFEVATTSAVALLGNLLSNTIRGNAGNDTLLGGAGNDSIWGSFGDDSIFGGNDDDRLDGGGDADVVRGGKGNDTVYGGTGNDTLGGDAGNDYLSGGLGNDTYRFSRGDGQDNIVDIDATAGNADVLQFQTDVAHDQLWFSQSGNNLVISIIGTNDKIMIAGGAASANFHIEQIKAGGKILSDTQVANLVQTMASMTPPAMGQTTLTDAQRTQLAPVLAANWN